MSSSLSRGLHLMEILADRHGPVGLAEIARCMGTSKSGIHELLATLVRGGYVERSTGGIYRLGLKAWEVGRAVPAANLVQVAGPIMETLVREVHEGVILGVLDGFEVVYVHLVEGPQAVRVHAAVGDRIPAHCTSTGLALLSQRDDSYLAGALPAKLRAFTKRTVVSRRALRIELRRTRERGFAINRGGWRLDVGGIAAQIGDGGEPILAGLCIAVPLYRMTAAWITRSAPLLIRASQQTFAALASSSDSTPRAA